VARVLLRLPVPLHRSLRQAARAAGLSFNEYCVRQLAIVPAADPAGVASVVLDRARALFGENLLGVVALGSWAAGRPARTSDIDVLIVIASTVALTRDLYRHWDQAPLSAEGRLVDPHFVHLPAPDTSPGAAWCESAVEGHVWYDRDGLIAARLVEIRRAIASGRLVRAFAHGQPYWKRAA
jgi:predicted nucleotidyltransferase